MGHYNQDTVNLLVAKHLTNVSFSCDPFKPALHRAELDQRHFTWLSLPHRRYCLFDTGLTTYDSQTAERLLTGRL